MPMTLDREELLRQLQVTEKVTPQFLEEHLSTPVPEFNKLGGVTRTLQAFRGQYAQFLEQAGVGDQQDRGAETLQSAMEQYDSLVAAHGALNISTTSILEVAAARRALQHQIASGLFQQEATGRSWVEKSLVEKPLKLDRYLGHLHVRQAVAKVLGPSVPPDTRQRMQDCIDGKSSDFSDVLQEVQAICTAAAYLPSDIREVIDMTDQGDKDSVAFLFSVVLDSVGEQD